MPLHAPRANRPFYIRMDSNDGQDMLPTRMPSPLAPARINTPRRPQPSPRPYIERQPPIQTFDIVEPEGFDSRSRAFARLLCVLGTMVGILAPIGLVFWLLGKRNRGG